MLPRKSPVFIGRDLEIFSSQLTSNVSFEKETFEGPRRRGR